MSYVRPLSFVGDQYRSLREIHRPERTGTSGTDPRRSLQDLLVSNQPTAAADEAEGSRPLRGLSRRRPDVERGHDGFDVPGRVLPGEEPGRSRGCQEDD